MSTSAGLPLDIGGKFCVVGSGPVGLSVAVTLANAGRPVVVIESGSHRPGGDAAALSDAEIADPSRHAEMRLAVARAFGGTGWLWGGRCLPLDDIDFKPRSHIDPAGWPISAGELKPFYAEAETVLECGGGGYGGRPWPGFPAGDDEIDWTTLERWCERPNVGERLAHTGAKHGLEIVLDTTVVDLELDRDTGSVTGLVVARGGERFRLGAPRALILACGGLETARLLLDVQSRRPELFGGANGPLGRYYMGHMSGRIGDIVFADPERGRAFDYQSESDGVVRRRLTIKPQALAREALPNISFSPNNPMLGDPGHRSGVLSALYLALSLPGIGRRFVSEAIRQSQIAGGSGLAPHVRNMLLDAPATAQLLANVAHQRFALGRSKPFLFVHSRRGAYPLHYHAEHAPAAQSRVQLGRQCDATGLRRLRIDLKFTADDARAVVRAHDVLDAGLRRTGLGKLVYACQPEQRAERVLAQASDGFHQIGLARMGRTQADSVVDADCCVHGVANLYLAGSAVFRTGGQANPTLTAAALGVRLAHRLAGRCIAEKSPLPVSA